MTNVVFIPGLGADERLFGRILTPGSNRHFIRWHKPEPHQTFASYISRLREQLASIQNPVLVGVSLGGIVAMELREVMPVKKTIIISSVKTKNEFPPYFSLVRTFRIPDLLPASLMKHSTPWIRPFISGSTSESDFELFKQMLHATDETFIHWSMHQVLHWERDTYTPGNLVHIHGTKDFVFPMRHILSCNYKIEDGAHDMILSRSDEINIILAKEIGGN